MRRGSRNKWRYDSSPRELCECGEIAICTFSENGVISHYCNNCAPSYVEREFDRQFPSRETPAPDNEVSLARFLALSGKSHKVSKTVETSTITRREETYLRLREKVRGNKWFDENA